MVPKKGPEDYGRGNDEVEFLGDPIPGKDLVKDSREFERTRSWLAKTTLIVCIGALLISGIVSLCLQNPVPLGAVWIVVGPAVGRVSACYFPRAP
jgi:hypothetical protein